VAHSDDNYFSSIASIISNSNSSVTTVSGASNSTITALSTSSVTSLFLDDSSMDSSVSSMDSSDSSSLSSDSSMDSSSDESFLRLCSITIGLSERETKFHRCRVAWENHALILHHEKQFDSKYRMSYGSFKKLVALLHPALEQNNTKSVNSCGELAICPSHILGLRIRWLSGSSFHDIRFSRVTFFRLLWKGISSIIQCKRLKIALPRITTELEAVKKGFESKSMEGVMSGCVGALNGFLLLIRTPSRKEASNVRQFYSGHYQWMGLNVQAVVDSNLRFMYAAILKGGRSSDYKAYMKSSLMGWIESLPPW
jgi:hypothetical protein